ncbi:MAG TPA: DsbC family protein [Casimicrobiaceae bacterium]|jgi:thiol:disulfide interchange protein DsbC|nr:DsbC family protein [Casimicrobiaceae bacterium]
MRISFVHLALAALLLALPPAALAQDAKSNAPRDAATRDAAAVKKLLEEKFPGATVTSVSKSPYFGLYEAQFDDRIVYTDAKVTYVMVGAIFDANTKQNLTDARQRQLNRVAWDSLPLDLAFKRVKGNGTRKFAMFSDADCPFCKRIENDIKRLDDVTIYTFLFPIDQLHPDAARKSAMIWCAADRAKAWDAFFEAGTLPDNKGDCATPIKDTALLGNRLRVSATPTLVFADGSMVPGALPLAQLEIEINRGEVEAKKLAAKK